MTTSAAPTRFRLAALPASAPTPFTIIGDKALHLQLAETLSLLDLRKLRLEGSLVPTGKRDWQIKARLGATVVQPCTISLEPVTTRIETEILRRYSDDYVASTDTESEMPEDDSVEPIPDHVDLIQVITEALALELPDYPRAKGLDPVDISAAPPDAAPIAEAEVKPFASLADLKKKMEGN